MASVMVIDASVLIALHNASDPNHDWSLDVFKKTLDHQWEMPVLTFAETLVHPIRAGKGDLFQQNVQGLGILVRDLPASAAGELADLRARTGLRMPDCVVLWQALHNKALLVTADRSLALKARELSLTVLEPTA